MRTITIETTVGEIVRALPACSRIFENLNIDYCCGGKISLAEVCKTKGLNAATVVAMLSALNQPANEVEANPGAMTMVELCDDVQKVHHGYLREELPRLDFMTRKVAAVHGDHEPRLFELRKIFEAFNAEMAMHINEEDEIVFPAIRKLEATKNGGSTAPHYLQISLERLEHEHDRAGAALERFKTLSDNYTPPDWACNTFRALYDGLARLEKDMHQHVHKENNVLFPRVLAVMDQASADLNAPECFRR
jgi:regulator of cell morphogenesis and NO signaling